MSNLITIFKALLHTSIVSAVMILLIIVIRHLIKNKVSANFIYFM